MFRFCQLAMGQDSLADINSQNQLSGYIRSIHLAQRVGLTNHWYALNGMHTRLNLDHAFASALRFRMDVRTQFLFGSAVAESPLYVSGFRQPGESADLHVLWWKRTSSVGYSNVERLALTYQKKEMTVVVGRQRIHWGMALGWNPMDIFQVGNPFDPDYVERPGVGAVRAMRSLGPLSGFEMAMARTGIGLGRGAWRYYTNRSGYDLQFLAGWFDRQPIVGAGWSGSAGNWSFRGEAQSFIPTAGEAFQLQSVLETDRLLKRNGYLRAAILYNKGGQTDVNGGLPSFSPTPKQLMPGKWNASVGWSRDPSLRFQYGVEVFYTSAAGTIVLFPRIEWVFSGDWSASLFFQLVKSVHSGSSAQLGFFRLMKTMTRKHRVGHISHTEK